MPAKSEIRSRRGIERRALTDAEKSDGYIGAVRSVIPYNSDSGLLADEDINEGKPFVEQIAPGAFKRSLENPADIVAFVGHTDDPLAAFARAGANLTFTDTADGLQWEALAPDTAACRDLMRLVDKGVIKGASFEFAVRSKGERWERRGEQAVRVITDAALYAVNPVAWPAYDDGALTVSMRSRRPVAESRGLYAYAESYESPLGDVTYAERVFAIAVRRFTDAQNYLRNEPNGAHVERARAEITAASADVQAAFAWLAANGVPVADDVATRAKEIAGGAEKRSTTPAASAADQFPITGAQAARLGLQVN